MEPSGTLADWREHVAEPCRNHPWLLFALCNAFAPPLLLPAGIDPGGFHVYGRSSRGKTLFLQVAASAWGCGADPAYSAERAYIRKWSLTVGAAEALAAAHNDGLLALDEIGVCAARDFAVLIYLLAGGQGRTPSRATVTCARPAPGAYGFSRAGNPSRQKTEEAKQTAHAGQLLRLIDLAIPETGLVESPSSAETQRRRTAIPWPTSRTGSNARAPPATVPPPPRLSSSSLPRTHTWTSYAPPCAPTSTPPLPN